MEKKKKPFNVTASSVSYIKQPNKHLTDILFGSGTFN